MATLTTALNTAFTPAAGDFIAQATDARAVLQRKNTAGAAWADVGVIDGSVIVSNPIAGAQYQFKALLANTTPTVQADQ